METRAEEAPADFAAFLIARNKLSPMALERARASTGQTQDSLVAVLSRLALLSEQELVAELAAFHGVSAASEDDFPETGLFADKINRRFLLHHHILPLREDVRGIALAMADPGYEAALKAFAFFSDRPLIRHVAALSDIDAAIERLYGAGTAKDTYRNLSENADEAVSEDMDRLSDMASEAPTIRLVHSLIAKAVQTKASDIHIEPFEDRIRVRFRHDGLLREESTHPKQTGAAIASRLKIMARLNIAERRLPQDGRIRFAVRGKDVDIRMSASPTIHGESVVLRILDRGNLELDFPALGFDEALHASTLRLLERPHGIVLVTGPTGSGKTTTLYTGLLHLNKPEKKILTIEDPIEYELDGINQQAVHPQIGRTFDSALRSFLRQDPDIIMVGEIRDGETAKVAVQAALTGHLILSTLHTNNAASAVTRLLDMGIDDFLLASTVTAVVGQRLVRKLCQACREPYEADGKTMAALPDSLPRKKPAPATLYKAAGCPACHGTGYSGRTMIAELLEVDDEIRKLITGKADAQDIQRTAVANGMRTMHRDGMHKALAGITTVEEVLRATQET